MALYSENKTKKSSLQQAKNHIKNFQMAFESNHENDGADANLDEKQSLVNNYFDFSY